MQSFGLLKIARTLVGRELAPISERDKNGPAHARFEGHMSTACACVFRSLSYLFPQLETPRSRQLSVVFDFLVIIEAIALNSRKMEGKKRGSGNKGRERGHSYPEMQVIRCKPILISIAVS